MIYDICSPKPEFLAKVESMACLVLGLLGVHHLRAEYIGPDTIHAGTHIVVQRGIPIEDADRITEEVRNRDHQGTGGHYCIIHVDPARMNGYQNGLLSRGGK